MLRAIWMMAQMVSDSHQRWKPSAKVPYAPFFAEPARSEPTVFDLDFIVDGERYQYGFKFDREKIREEWLYSFPKHRPRLIFERDSAREEEYRFGRVLRGKPQLIAGLTRQNSLFLSAAAANNNAQLAPMVAWFEKQFLLSTPERRKSLVEESLAQAKQDPAVENKFISLLRSADLGISEFRFVDQEWDEEAKLRVANVLKALRPDKEFEEPDWRELAREAQFGHRTESGEVVFLDVHDESDGTRAWIALIGAFLVALDEGHILLVDELDASLHPRLTSEVIQLFHDPEVNVNGAQLIFSTHDPSLMGALLGDSPLRRDEVWLSEKGRDGAARVYPLTDFRPRKAENLERGYLQGRYGGVPFVDRELAVAALRGRGNDDGAA